jgi:hypothetical protein
VATAFLNGGAARPWLDVQMAVLVFLVETHDATPRISKERSHCDLSPVEKAAITADLLPMPATVNAQHHEARSATMRRVFVLVNAAAIVVALFGIAASSEATLGVAIVGLACVLGITARIAQAAHYQHPKPPASVPPVHPEYRHLYPDQPEGR